MEFDIKELEELKFIHKIRCVKCNKLLGGVLENGYVTSCKKGNHYSNGDCHIFVCGKNEKAIAECGAVTTVEMSKIREKLKNKTYKEFYKE